MSGDIKIHVLHCGRVRVSPNVPYGGSHCSLLKAAGLTTPPKDRLWLPVSAYLIEHPEGLFLLDTGWNRAVSPQGAFDARAQIAHMGLALYLTNQAVVDAGHAVDEQLAGLGVKPADIDCVLLSHLDCDHVSGLGHVRDARRILVAHDELEGAKRNPIRFHKKMWEDIPLDTFRFEEASIGPFGRSFDLLGDDSIRLVAVPGHSAGLFATMVTGKNGKFALLVSDGAYSSRSWREMIRPGVSLDGENQMASLEWIRQVSLNEGCAEVLANHDPDVEPHVIVLSE